MVIDLCKRRETKAMNALLTLGVAAFSSVLAGISNAQSYKLGGWVIDKNIQGIQIATTKNESDSVVGLLCAVSDRQCFAYVIFDGIGCDEGVRYPMMINSAVGAYSISTICRQLPGSNNSRDKIYVVNEFENVKEALESGGQVGFVMPLASGQFRVARFNASGATAAIRDVMTLPADGGGAAPTRRRGSGDRSL